MSTPSYERLISHPAANADRRTKAMDVSGRGMLVVLFAYLIIEFGRPQAILPVIGVIRPALILGTVLILFSLGRLREDIYKDKSIRLLIAFVGLGGLSLLWVVNHYYAFNTTVILFLHTFAVVIPMCVLLNNERRLKALFLFWVAVHCYLAVYGFLHAGAGPGGFLLDENDLALALNCALPYAYFLHQSKSMSAGKKTLLKLALVLIVAGIVATMSRGGFVGLAVSALAIVWFSKNRLRNLAIVVIMGIVFAAVMPAEYREEITTISDTTDSTRSERLDSWSLAWDMFLDNPVLGVGYGNYPWTVTPYQLANPELRDVSWLGGRVSHSLYFTLLPETGLVGTTIFIMLVAGMFKSLRASIRVAVAMPDNPLSELVEASARATIVAMVAFLATAAFVSVLYYPQFWYAVGFAYVIRMNAPLLENAS